MQKPDPAAARTRVFNEALNQLPQAAAKLEQVHGRTDAAPTAADLYALGAALLCELRIIGERLRELQPERVIVTAETRL